MTITATAVPLEQCHNSFIPLLKSLTFLWSSQLAESFSLHWSARTRRIKQDWMNAPKVPRIVALSLSLSLQSVARVRLTTLCSNYSPEQRMDEVLSPQSRLHVAA